MTQLTIITETMPITISNQTYRDSLSIISIITILILQYYLLQVYIHIKIINYLIAAVKIFIWLIPNVYYVATDSQTSLEKDGSTCIGASRYFLCSEGKVFKQRRLTQSMKRQNTDRQLIAFNNKPIVLLLYKILPTTIIMKNI